MARETQASTKTMKTLEEKKLLVKMSQMLGQPVDPELVESIKREEYLNRKIFEKEIPPPAPVLQEVVVVKPEPVPAPKPAETNIVPAKQDLVQQVVNTLGTTSKNPLADTYRDKEIEGIRKTLAEMMQKISTMSWGSGGTGSVYIDEMVDFDKSSYAEGRYLKWTNGKFRLDDINSQQVTYNTTTTATNYTAVDNDYYIGVTAGPVTITLPSSTTSGRTIVIKDETGNAQNNNITIAGTIDNDAGGVILAINNGAVQLLFRNGWRII
jgi:hypothetical protein